jgi:hypothetical protein
MSLKTEQIEHLEGRKSHSRKEYKRQRNRKIRRVRKDEIPNIKYNGWEY